MNREIKLNNGVLIPLIGYGTWLIEGEDASNCVKAAIDVGYRHIDTAEAYENEFFVGRGVKNSHVNRADMFVTTKLAAECKDYDSAKRAIEKSLSDLNLGYIDLMIIHSPQPWKEYRNGQHYFEGNLQAWKALEEFYRNGKIRAIGVSNFQIEDLKNILDNCEIRPAVNQILAHIGCIPVELIDFCHENGIVVEAHSPFGHGELLHDERITKIADKYGVSASDLAIQYLYNLQIIPLPKTKNVEHMKSNLNVNFDISEEDMKYLGELKFDDYGKSTIFPVYAKK